ncbi:MAG: glycosyltransferase family 39 protein, partial [Bdellovibrionales bacterium]|nr:glycosyltransferase family 39 protein [Bdellovibrionales bacterium]
MNSKLTSSLLLLFLLGFYFSVGRLQGLIPLSGISIEKIGVLILLTLLIVMKFRTFIEKNEKKIIYSFFLLFIAFRFWWAFFSDVMQTSDSKYYLDQAIKMTQGEPLLSLYKQTGPSVIASLFMWLSGVNSYIVGVIPIFIFSCLEIFLLYKLTRMFFGFIPALISVLLIGFWPEHIVYSNIVSNSLYQGVLLLLFAYFFHIGLRVNRSRLRIALFLFSGLFAAMAQYMRATSLIFMISFLFIYLVSKTNWRCIFLVLTGFVIGTLPILVFNYKNIGIVSFSPSQFSGYSLLIGTNLSSRGHYYETFGQEVDEEVEKLVREGKYVNSNLNILDKNRVATNMKIKNILKNPIEFVKVAVEYKMPIFWADGASFTWSLQEVPLVRKFPNWSAGVNLE